MHPLQHAPVDELAQVATHGLLGDGEVRGEGADLDPAVRAGPDQDLALTLVRLHRAPSRSDPCDLGHASSLHEGTGISEPGWADFPARFMWGVVPDFAVNISDSPPWPAVSGVANGRP